MTPDPAPAEAVGGTEPFPWMSALEMGQADIDRDHREAVEEGNRLVRLLDARDSWTETLELLRQALGRSTRHFDTEDDILKATRYPGADEFKSHLMQVGQVRSSPSRVGPRRK